MLMLIACWDRVLALEPVLVQVLLVAGRWSLLA
jgi:hypothetical protein